MDRNCVFEFTLASSRARHSFERSHNYLASLSQIDKWGNVEWHHDIELYDVRARVAAATLMVHFSNEDDKTIKFRQDFKRSNGPV